MPQAQQGFREAGVVSYPSRNEPGGQSSREFEAKTMEDCGGRLREVRGPEGLGMLRRCAASRAKQKSIATQRNATQYNAVGQSCSRAATP
jgi:hypothetical protein